MSRLLVISLLIACLVAPAEAAQAVGHEDSPASLLAPVWKPEGIRPSLEVPFNKALHRAEEEANGEFFDFYHTSALGDLNHDGMEDLLAHHWRLRASDTGAGYSGMVTLTALSGDGGQRLWRVRRELSNSLPLPAQEARVGPRGVRGALLFIDSHFPTFSLSTVAIDDRGRVIWERSFESTYSYQMPVSASNLPTGLDLFDALPGRATEILVGLLDYVDSMASLRVVVVDGRDGTLTAREPLEIAVGAFPTLTATGDLDQDNMDDYVVAGHGPEDGGHVTASSGADGSPIWYQDKVNLGGPFIWAQNLGPITRNQIPNIVVSAPSEGGDDRFHLLDGKTGQVMWQGRGTFPYFLGDMDGDGSNELGVTSVWEADGRMGEEFRAYSREGFLLYERRYSVNRQSCGRSCSVTSYLLDAGDLDNDEVEDLSVQRYLDNREGLRTSTYLVTGRDGAKHLKGLKATPILGSVDSEGDDLARIQRHASGRSVITAYDGRDGTSLWSSRLRGAVVGAVEPYQGALRVDATRDNLFVTSERRGIASVVVLDGRSGAVLWSRKI